jgi:hypothetical protein
MDFRDRAWFEAERYGQDPWIFVRELLQNARDAGARSVHFITSEHDGRVHLTCRDDGDGMTEGHARQFLFRLYASSKENQSTAAGRFGVGFWSILRFEPSHIVIRSWPKNGEPWEVSLDGSLEHATSTELLAGPSGTEIALTRAFTPLVAATVKRSAWQHGRYLMTRHDRGVPLLVMVDGERVTEELKLPAPSTTFARRGVRGAVGLSTTARVELFSKGLHVRSAVSVDALLAAPDEKKGRARQLDPLLEGLAPQVILDGERLNLTRSRSDAREDRALKKAVHLAQGELARLIEQQLQLSRPVPLWPRLLRPALVVAAVGAFLTGGAWLVSGLLRTSAAWPTPIATQPPPEVPYLDPAATYRGPRTDALPATSQLTALKYSPASQTPYLAALHLQFPEDRATLQPTQVRRPYPSHTCMHDCVDLQITLLAKPGLMRLPVPTGQVMDVTTLWWGLQPMKVFASPQGEPVVQVTRGGLVKVQYRTGPGVPVLDPPLHEPASLPAGAPEVRGLRTEQAVEVLRDWVVAHVKYSNDPEVGERLRALDRQGVDFITRTLQVGAGDCDVQNALLAMLLQSSGVNARLTIGFVGRDGRAEPLLHAWVEYRGDGELWRVTDASAPLAQMPPVAGLTNARTVFAVRQRMARSGVEDSEVEPVPVPSSEAGRLPVPKTPEGVPQEWRLAVPAIRVPPSAVGLLGLAPLLAFAFIILRPKVTRQTQLDEQHDISRLLQGALARPEAFQHVAALFEQPLVPRRGKGLISLSEAYALAAAHRLYSSDAGLPFSERAVEAGAVVLDAMRPEGRVVAEALGAVNLDRWDRLLRQAHFSELLERVNATLRERGERWVVMVSSAVTQEPAVLKVPGTKDERWIVVNADASWLARAGALFPERPARALFGVIDQLAVWLRLNPSRKARLLSRLARSALHEELSPPAPKVSPVAEVSEPEEAGVRPNPLRERPDR